MQTYNFPNPKLNLPKELRDTDEGSTQKTFEGLENYLQMVKPYIYTKINLDYLKSDEKHFHAWMQRLLSANLLRSLYIRNAVVDAFNTRNIVALFGLLKSWLEIMGALAYILDLLGRDRSADEFDNLIQRFSLGNKGTGNLRVGTIEAIGVSTMLDKANAYMTKIRKDSPEHSNFEGLDTYITDLYDTLNNNSHPAFDANDMVEFLDYYGTWHGKNPDEIKQSIFNDRHGYLGSLGMTVFCIESICKKISEIEIDHFVKLKSELYFE